VRDVAGFHEALIAEALGPRGVPGLKSTIKGYEFVARRNLTPASVSNIDVIFAERQIR
jgi:hypothetical protein